MADNDSHDQSADPFLRLIQESRRGKFKIYIGMSTGVGKSYRMFQEVDALLRNGIDVKTGFFETENRAETQALTKGLPAIPRRTLFYKGSEVEEVNVQAVINAHPEPAPVNELTHTDVSDLKNEKGRRLTYYLPYLIKINLSAF